MPIILIAACAGASQVIGNHGALPWHFSCDLKFFKTTTRGHAILMGRKTFDGIIAQFGRPLPDRRHLIISRDPTYRPAVGEVFSTIPAAIAAVPPDEDLFVVGGQQIYEQTLPFTDKILLTRIEKDYSGDAFFPMLDPAQWHLTDERQEIEADVALRFCAYVRT